MLRKRFGRLYASLLLMLVIVTVAGTVVLAAGPAKNVILLIGDGMGPAERTLVYYYLGEQPAMNQMSVVGMYTTHPAFDGYTVTDSAAAATALASGVKTYSGAVGVDAEQRLVPTVLELARDAGKATGLVATSRINHATPAAFAAHEVSRNNYDQIMADFLEAKVDVMLGGGRRHTLPKSAGGVRKDGRNLQKEFASAGYTVINERSALEAVQRLPVLGVFASSDLAPDIDRNPALEPSVAEMTQKAIDLLSQDPDGFFLMVEGSQIDFAGHANDVIYSATETAAFDQAVQVALNFADSNEETLVIVTADHDTGALSIGRNYHLDPTALRQAKYSAGKIASYITSSSSVATVLQKYAGIPDPTAAEISLVRTSSDKAKAIKKILDERVGVIWGSGNHNGVMIPLSAQGAGAAIFGGFYDNTDVAKKIAAAMGLKL